MTTTEKLLQAPWVNPHDKSQKQWLPWIKEKVIIWFNDGSIHEGWHGGGDWRVYAKPARRFENDAVKAWAYPSKLTDLTPVSAEDLQTINQSLAMAIDLIERVGDSRKDAEIIDAGNKALAILDRIAKAVG